MSVPVRRSDEQYSSEGASLFRWDPFEELDRLNRQLSSYLDSFRRLPSVFGEAFVPVADVEETDDTYVVEIELPGVKREDIKVEITGRRVSVDGERKEKERTGVLRRRERTVGRFHYEVTLPGEVDEGKAEARLDEGVLQIRLPKPESVKPRRIEIR
ncbi:MAG: Hsp20/alpha crystallin family protein [Acidimicrobiales bacterium]|nr:Hsp20/alpha crystallin family protein [Acidimicrobiales bacterium]